MSGLYCGLYLGPLKGSMSCWLTNNIHVRVLQDSFEGGLEIWKHDAAHANYFEKSPKSPERFEAGIS